jgi:hypothetical protein
VVSCVPASVGVSEGSGGSTVRLVIDKGSMILMTEREFAENAPATDSILISLAEDRILTGFKTRYIYLLGLGQEARSGIHYALLLSPIQVT